MQTSLRVLKQRVRESRYVVDERAVADAILTRREDPPDDRAELQLASVPHRDRTSRQTQCLVVGQVEGR